MSLLRLCADLRSTLNSLIPNSGVSYLNSSPSALSDRLHPVCSRVTTDNLPTYTTAHNSPFFPLFSRFFFHHRPHLPYFSVLRPFLLHQAPFPFLIREPPPRLRSTQSQNQNADGPSHIYCDPSHLDRCLTESSYNLHRTNTSFGQSPRALLDQGLCVTRLRLIALEHAQPTSRRRGGSSQLVLCSALRLITLLPSRHHWCSGSLTADPVRLDSLHVIDSCPTPS